MVSDEMREAMAQEGVHMESPNDAFCAFAKQLIALRRPSKTAGCQNAII